ncbi:GIY-YIG nuclease family protein [Methanogenium organophilum]|uniref:GIY-YIG nuclease family protein n=1 Tax=Methanogenium organophilum TaxID=2199 RepID=A0A9X9T6V7_METOG|nr:GIY-YIG nuclease family protein [Methanogenium organophilum]WAI00115.1 GIY-YIG nuclease family protein [Methanogenium organophilum]
MVEKGIYCLILYTEGAIASVGALGEVVFPAGWYIYVGSALGPGGLARVARHIRLFHGDSTSPPRWHIDYLLTDNQFVLERVISAETTERLECTLAQRLGYDGVKGFGCSDCRCTTHLLYRKENPQGECRRALTDCGCIPVEIHVPHGRTGV